MNITSSNEHHDSILRILRGLMPNRPLTYSEALQIAERQASKLLSILDITDAPTPIEIITEQPRIRLQTAFDMPASGSAHWDGNDWVISLNASEYHRRQRYTVCHEYKHVLDHPVRHHQIRLAPQSHMEADEANEKVADYFAACLLMPRMWVKDAFHTTSQNVDALATQFQVSAVAMSYRLSHLGLRTVTDRCRPPHGRRRPRSDPSDTRLGPTYHRHLPEPQTNLHATGLLP